MGSVAFAMGLAGSGTAWAQATLASPSGAPPNAEARTAGVAQAVLGIMSYVRWPQESGDL